MQPSECISVTTRVQPMTARSLCRWSHCRQRWVGKDRDVRRGVVGCDHPMSAKPTRSRAVPSPLAGHAVNPSMGARWRHPCRRRSRNRREHRTSTLVGRAESGPS